MTYLLGANKTPELSWASRHISGLWLNRGDGRRVKKKDRDWMFGAGFCFRLYLNYTVPLRVQSMLQMSKTSYGSMSCKCGSERVLLSGGRRLWRPASGWEPNICGGSAVILNRLSASTAGDGGANLGGVNQDHLSMLAAWSGGPPTHPTAGPPR